MGALTGSLTLTGYHSLGIHRETGALVVLAEATTPAGRPVHLPHHCPSIPQHVHDTYAMEIAQLRTSL